ncbi:MAG TPA: MFS transporter [Methanoregulaceae archaeon]|nr:MAG: MFS transporter [Methanolinea sp.]HON82407.1 MFS transporter [Methanoregulaceae archaeon]HPD11310.1 MFS transporter [Methanoregulaceae archaeon]HRT16198.1 MFS transporter [Methanoregulaceae archaeon]HRU31745.1 MFS transporter [Methanoregulaceae archaeon]
MERQQKIVLSVLVLGTMMGALDSTIVILAFPVIAEKLNADLLTTMWIILIYLLVVAVLTVQLGRLGDIFGRPRMFNLGFGIFTAGSFLCGISPTINMLILFRGVQALGGAFMESNSGAIIADIFPPNSRGAAFGYNSMGWTIGAMFGIVLGGVITTFFGWEYIFFMNIPIGIVALYLGLRYIKVTTRIRASLDIAGMVLLGAALTLISFGAVDFAGYGLSLRAVALAVMGIILIPVFIRHELHTEAPMIDFASLSRHILKYSLLAAFFQSLGYIAMVFLIIMYLQGIRGLSPLDAALLLTPGYIVGSVLGPYMGKLSDRIGARFIATGGTMVISAAILIYMTLQVDTSLYVVLIASFVSGVGTSMFYPANNSAIMANAREEDYGSVSGTLRMVQNTGILGSYVVAISVASASIPRELAFEVFVGTSVLVGHVTDAFIKGIDAALLVALILLILAGAMSWSRGSEQRGSV